MTNSQQWMRNIEPTRNFSAVLVYFDLVNHSEWHERVRRGRWAEPYEARRCLANDLQSRLERVSVYRHHWSGDGGLFVIEHQNEQSADHAYQAMVMMYDIFREWKDRVPNRSTLECRITGTYCSDICAGPEPEYWSSSDLNDFLKYEGRLGYRGAICITNSLFVMLSPQTRTKFEDRKRNVALEIGAMVTYNDADHPITRMSRALHNGGTWLGSPDPSVATYRVGRLPPSAVQVGDSVLLSTAPASSGYRSIELHLRGVDDPQDFLSAIEDRDRSDWNRERNALTERDVSGNKLRVRRIALPLLDDDTFRIEYSVCDYREVRAFCTLLENNPGVRNDYLFKVLSVQEDETMLPNLLSNHALVIFGRAPERKLVMCRRARRMEGAGGYYGGRWSVSLEEQYKPDVDSSIRESVERGVREELLLVSEYNGVLRDYPGTVKVSIQAFQVETLSLLYGFLAVVELPDVERFEDLVARWSKAPDRAEHAAIAALRMSPGVLKECLASEGVPRSIREDRAALEPGPGFDAALREEKEGGDPWQWHPTSPVRLALALSLADAPESAEPGTNVRLG